MSIRLSEITSGLLFLLLLLTDPVFSYGPRRQTETESMPNFQADAQDLERGMPGDLRGGGAPDVVAEVEGQSADVFEKVLHPNAQSFKIFPYQKYFFILETVTHS